MTCRRMRIAVRTNVCCSSNGTIFAHLARARSGSMRIFRVIRSFSSRINRAEVEAPPLFALRSHPTCTVIFCDVSIWDIITVASTSLIPQVHSNCLTHPSVISTMEPSPQSRVATPLLGAAVADPEEHDLSCSLSKRWDGQNHHLYLPRCRSCPSWQTNPDHRHGLSGQLVQSPPSGLSRIHQRPHPVCHHHRSQTAGDLPYLDS